MPGWPSPPIRDFMPKPLSGREPQPMEREVDRLLAQLSHFGTAKLPAPEPRATPAPATVILHRTGGLSAAVPSGRDLAALWARALLAVALGGLMTQWPYPHGCGWPLLGYLGAVFTVLLAASWVGIATWKLRSALAHILSLILFFWGTVLAAEQLLPRIGYAADEATWECPLTQGITAAPSTPR
jgi:hypothetical protein